MKSLNLCTVLAFVLFARGADRTPSTQALSDRIPPGWDPAAIGWLALHDHQRDRLKPEQLHARLLTWIIEENEVQRIESCIVVIKFLTLRRTSDVDSALAFSVPGCYASFRLES